MTTLEAIAKLSAIDAALGFTAADALDADDQDRAENVEAARDHIMDAIDALKNTLSDEEAA